MKTERLDLKDRQLLFELERNARQPVQSLASKLGISVELAHYRIKRLVKSGVIKFFLGYINFAKLGLVDYGLYVSTQMMSEQQESVLVEFFREHPNCAFFARLGGPYDYVAGMLAPDPIWLSETLSEVTNRFGEFLYRYEIITRINAAHFPKQYLLDATEAPSESTYFGGKLEHLLIDKLDERLLHFVATNGRANYVDMANEVGISDTAARQRILSLEKLRIITGYMAWIEPQSIGYQSHNLLVKCQNLHPNLETELYQFCRNHRHITWLIKTIGLWDFEIGVETKSQEDLQLVLRELKRNFSRSIQRIEFVPIFETIKYNQYPLN